jgi:hypothetical protein
VKRRPYFAFGRRQLRIGWKWQVQVPAASCPQHEVCGRTHSAFTDWRYRWIGLTWQ